MKIAEFLIRNERDVKTCVRRIRSLSGLADLTRQQRTDLCAALSEILGTFQVAGTEQRVELSIVDRDDGQAIEAVIRCGDQDVSSVEVGHLADLVDQFRTCIVDNGETVVRLAQTVPVDAVPLEKSDLKEWGAPFPFQAKSQPDATQDPDIKLVGKAELVAAQKQMNQLKKHLDLGAASLETLNMLSLVANKTDNPVFVLDRLGAVDWANAAFVRLTGYRFEEIADNKPIEFLSGAATSHETRQIIDESFGLGHGATEDIQLYRKDGNSFWASVTLTPVTDEHGQVVRWIVICSDITRRRQAHDELQIAKQAAEEDSRAKSEFLANMSHEIRTPMNAIIGMTELALDTTLSADQRNYLRTVKKSADALLGLLNDILDLSKIEAGKIDFESIPFNLNELLTSTLSSLAVRADTNSLDLTWRLPAEVPIHLVGDPVRLRQVLVNLVSNAIKFTAKGQVVVTVECQWENDDETSIHFSVADTGIGIPADRLERIFHAFEQADSSTTRRFGGTGLGLTICNKLVRLMGGKIWVQSQLNRGSTFHFSLRFKKNSELVERILPAVERAVPHEPELAPSSFRILVADDHEANRDLVTAILSKRGHQVNFAVNGREALNQLDNEPFDVVLMDVQMPEMDGYQATAALREREKKTHSRHMPIIALTAHAMKGDREKCLAAGMDAYLPKPINAKELQTLVEKLAAVTDASVNPQKRACHCPDGPVNDQQTVPLAHVHDFSAALNRLDGDQNLLTRQMEFFLKDTPTLLATIHRAIESGDGNSLMIAAHRLKGFAASYDAHDAVELALQLERLGDEGSLDGARELQDGLQFHINGLGRAIKTYIGE